MYVFPNENFHSDIQFSFSKHFWDEQTAPISNVNFEDTEQKLMFRMKLYYTCICTTIVVFKGSLRWKLPF